MLLRTSIIVLLLSLAVFCEKTSVLPKYLPKTKVDDDVMKFLESQDSLMEKVTGFAMGRNVSRDLLGRLTSDTTIYVLRRELVQKKIAVGVVDLSLRNRIDNSAIEFQKTLDGRKFARLNGNVISLDEYRKMTQSTFNRNKNPFVRYENLTAREIKNLISGSNPIHIFLKKEHSIKLDEDYSVIFNYSGLNGLHSIGVNGREVGLFYEEGCPDVGILNSNYFIQSGDCLTANPHSNKVVKILQTTAPEAMVVNFNGFDAVVSIVRNNANRFTPPLEIGSYSWHVETSACMDGLYCGYDQELDQHIYEDRLVYFVAAGNMSDANDVFVGSPGKALNAITVGAVDPYMKTYISQSKWKNSEIKNQKPEIANYTNFQFSDVGNVTGTSASTPYSAAIAALMMSVDTDLKRHPEVIKAIFFVNARDSIDNARSHDRDDWFSVASRIPHFDVNEGFSYRLWSGSNGDIFDNNEKIVFTETGVMPGLHCRAAISWLTSGSYAGEQKLLAQDLDLYVYQGTMELTNSISVFNPFEVVDFITQNSSQLRFEIHRVANSFSDDVALGFAMRCGNE